MRPDPGGASLAFSFMKGGVVVQWLRLLTQINRTLWAVVVAMQVSRTLVQELNRYQRSRERRKEVPSFAADERAETGR